MKMKKFCFCLMVLSFTLSCMGMLDPVFAQGQPAGDDRQPPSAEDIVAKMQSKLNLTQDQVTAVTPIIEKYSSKHQDLRKSMQDATADRDSMHAQMKQLKADEKQELSQVLSTDQMGQFDQMMNQG